MEALLVYLVKSGGLLAAFFLAYYFLLRKETFFNSNRWFLLLGLVTSIILPLVTFKKVVWVDPSPMNIAWSELPMAPPAESGFEIDWFIVMAWVYAIGIFIFLIKFLFDFGSLVKTLKGQTIRRQADFKFVDVTHNVSPFSYFNYIVYNSALYTQAELENILEHEKVHCEQKHSADVLIARLFCILFWFNPFVWLYKKAMLQNLEFIADSQALKNISDKKAYQITLLKVTTHENCVEITNHFYQSLIKKRIIMLNKNQSKKWNSWKYVLIVPVLAAFMFYFQVKVIAQEKITADMAAVAAKPVDITINKNTTDAQLNAYTTEFKKQFGTKLKFSKVKRNNAGEIVEIKVQYDDKNGKTGSWHVREDKPIGPLRLHRKDDGSIAFGGDKKVHIISHNGNESADTDTDSLGTGKKTCSYSYSYSDGDDDDVIYVNGHRIDIPDAPDAPDFPDPVKLAEDIKNSINVKTITNKDGKVVVSVNGEIIDVDPEKILAEIDLQAIKEQAEAGARMARKQADMAQRHADLARLQSLKSRNGNDEETRRELEETRREMEETRREIDETRRELDEARRELEKERAELRAKRTKSTKSTRGQGPN